MDSEWAEVDPGDPLRQGDLLVCREPKRGMLQEMCLIITADCDLEQNKFGHFLACLKIVLFEDYLKKIWGAKKLNKELNKWNLSIKEQLNKWHSLLSGKTGSLTNEAIMHWVNRSSPEEICNTLDVPNDKKKNIQDALATYRDILAIANDHTISDSLAKVVNIRARSENKEIPESVASIVSQARQEKMPDDIFLIPYLPEPIAKPAVILLREIVGVEICKVCYYASEASSSDLYLRVSRLQPVYKYGVTQAFGSLFSRIGFPKEYETRCNSVVKNINEMNWS